MAARGYEFYLQVLIVFLTSELRSLVRDNFSTKFLLKTQLFFIHFRNSKIVQLKWYRCGNLAVHRESHR